MAGPPGGRRSCKNGGGMRVRVLFFGQLKDLVGCSSDEAEFEPGARLETVFEHYASQHPRLRNMATSVAMARNQSFAPASEAIEDGDEVAIMPPVSGGSEWLASADRDGVFAAVTQAPIDSAALVQRVQSDGDGAVLVFEGVVRDKHRRSARDVPRLRMLCPIGSSPTRRDRTRHIGPVRRACHRLGASRG